MLMESDLIVAYLKKEDWLKPVAIKIFDLIKQGELNIEISTEVFHELAYVLLEISDFDTTITNLTYLYSLDNVHFIQPSPQVYITAIELMKTYGIKSLFDSIYAAQALIQTNDKVILSTDHIYDRIDGLKRLDPREVVKKL